MIGEENEKPRIPRDLTYWNTRSDIPTLFSQNEQEFPAGLAVPKNPSMPFIPLELFSHVINGF
jgi:hypothetical protein